ncbi:MAG TPA: tetratricopeptide repeat protein [Magnetospirillaceae bacterium]|nr:tetratricopeptide repeat protein [Magnetospirillaceae bacterium]
MSNNRTLMAAAILGLMAAHTASAQEAKVVLGPTLLDQCANAAAEAQKTGNADRLALDVCSDAIDRAWATHSEQAVAYLDRGTLNRVAGDNQQALADFTSAIKDDPSLAAAYNDRGATYSALHRPAEAVRDYTQALALHAPNAAQVLFNRALAYEDQGDTKQAYIDYRAAAETNPDWDLPAKQLARFAVGH